MTEEATEKKRISFNKEALWGLLLILTATCIVGAAALAITFNVTKPTIEQTVLQERNATIKKVLPPFSDEVEEMKIIEQGEEHVFFIARDKTALVGVATEESAIGYGGAIKVMVGLLPNGEIYDVRLLQHHETPGLGAKAGAVQFTAQFKGKSIGTKISKINDPSTLLSVIKPGEKALQQDKAIDAITAATITSQAFTDAVNKALVLFVKHKNKLLK